MESNKALMIFVGGIIIVSALLLIVGYNNANIPKTNYLVENQNLKDVIDCSSNYNVVSGEITDVLVEVENKSDAVYAGLQLNVSANDRIDGLNESLNVNDLRPGEKLSQRFFFETKHNIPTIVTIELANYSGTLLKVEKKCSE